MAEGLVRYQSCGDTHFVTFSCYRRRAHFDVASARKLFERSLEAMRLRYDFCVFGYVVMPEHVHLLVTEPKKALLSKAIQALKLSVAVQRRERPFWQARYYDFNVFTVRKHVEKLKYIHRNPVTRGVVENPEDWPWSSFRHYFTGEAGAVEIESWWTSARRESVLAGTHISKARCGAVGANSYAPVYTYVVPPGGYAPNGNILVHSDSVMGDWGFTYDAVDRLSSAVPDVNAPTQYLNNYGCWSYDAFGNRTLEAFSTVACTGNPTPMVKTTYNPVNNQISSSTWSSATLTAGSYVYDASGNTLFDGNNQYWYDAEGQLCAQQSLRTNGAPIVQYVYDAEGARIGKGTPVAAPSSSKSTCAPPLGTGFQLNYRYLVDQSGDQVTELNGSGSWQHSNVWAGGKLVATYDVKGLHFDIADPLGTKRVQANVAGQVDEYCMSLPFGNDINNPVSANCVPQTNSLSTADDATENHFTGKEHDTESGNDFFGSRYYVSSLGRWMSPDIAGPNPGNPQALNLYRYGFNNPMRFTDPNGYYERDVHYDLTQVLAYAAGFSPAQSFAIARGDQGVDDSPISNPWSGYGFAGPGARRDFHFTSDARRAELWQGFLATADLGEGFGEGSLGQYLHAEQDSFSHAGYGPLLGHLYALHGPDKTYTNPDKSDTMAQVTYATLLAGGNSTGTETVSVPLAVIMPFIQAFNRATTKKEKDAQLDLLKKHVVQYRKDHKDEKGKKYPDDNHGGGCPAEFSTCG